MFDQEISEAEKIDRTYKMLLANRRSKWIGLMLKVLIIWGLYYGYHYLQQPENVEQKQAILKEIRTKLSEFITPLVQDLVGDMLNNMQSASSAGGNQAAATPEITPEMIEAVRNSMKK